MEILTFNIPDLKFLKLNTFTDDRGFFVERFRKSVFADHGLPTEFLQDNFSRSKANVLRGLHFQWDRPQGKLVTCLRGRILDVVVDMRVKSPTFGSHQSIELDGNIPSFLWVPRGFAHGFCVLGNEEADVLYKVDNDYSSIGESGIRWSDPDLKIKWPLNSPILSPKDEKLMSWSDYLKNPYF